MSDDLTPIGKKEIGGNGRRKSENAATCYSLGRTGRVFVWVCAKRLEWKWTDGRSTAWSVLRGGLDAVEEPWRVRIVKSRGIDDALSCVLGI